ncbi:DNA-binding response regulator, NarL/FixJ family, contains REC and HTH domains [Gillisia sp. Hel1_33_143]|uniref:response regulator transcription factor n=1 Tax=Gillisia sp. Hel1_33_143 TaxID=1336796 RepID=UPI00087A4244|nr:response regulator transcription factor [Gillisia sp. Hel1_33_143]SDS82477.1 DNA-binding response regulator, NarL/FixJ family, contains REC and HTH domains [Gillisia sp. Hel1_33_143]
MNLNKKVIIVDDHVLFAQSLKGLVNSYQNYEVVEVFKNGSELVAYFEANKKRPDLVLLDIKMPVLSGLETMHWLHQHHPDQKVLTLTMEDDEYTILSMVNYGCRGYLLKDIDPEEFLYALETVLESGYYFTGEPERIRLHQATPNAIKDITARELDFIKLACTEMTYKQVAEQMNLSPKTIDGYRESLFHKLSLKSRVGLVLYAFKHQLVKV